MSTRNRTSTDSPVLIPTANNFSNEESDRRDVRYERRKEVQKFTRMPRLADCGNTAVGEVYIGTNGKNAYFTKLATCGSVWTCSVCSAKILAARSDEVKAAIDAWDAKGGTFVFETLTMAHSKSDSLRKVWNAVGKAFTATNSGGESAKHKEFGQYGYLKVVEITHGANGWHVHLHVLRFIERPLESKEMKDWSNQIFAKWSGSLQKQGFKSPTQRNHKFDLVLSPAGLEKYLIKGFDNSEVSSSAAIGVGKFQAGRGIWGVLDAAIADSKSAERKVWFEWETGSHRKRQVSWSKDLRKNLGLNESKEDEELAKEEDAFVPLIRIEDASVRLLGRLGRIQSRILRAVEKEDIVMACHLLNEHGIKWWLTQAGLQLAQKKS